MLEIYDNGYRLHKLYHMYIEAFLNNLRLLLGGEINIVSEHEYQSLKRPTHDIEMLTRKHACEFILSNMDLMNELRGNTVGVEFNVETDKLKIKVRKMG